MLELISAVATETLKESFLMKIINIAKETLGESFETVLKESPVESMINTIEKTSLESLQIQNIDTINKHLEGTIHPETSVPFIRKTVENISGEIIEGVFPDFKDYRLFEVVLPEKLYQETDPKQFDYCNQKLKESFDKGTINTEHFTERQLDQIGNGDKPEGLTWHHNEEKGRMELVEQNIHQATAHTGGRFIYGGGSESR